MSDQDNVITTGIHTGIVAIADIKPEKLDTLKAVLKELTEHPDNSPISQIETIHFAIWCIIDDGKRLLFQSNFDRGLFEYLKEFSDTISDGLDKVFSACVGYPEGGARDFAAFVEFAKAHLVTPQYYYNAYPSESVKDIKKALDIKDALKPFLNEAGDQKSKQW